MNIQEQHGEPQRREGLGGRVRRFVDNELNRVLDKENRSADQGITAQQREADRAAEFDRETDADHTYEPDRPSEPDRAMPVEPVTTYPDASERAAPATTTPVDRPVHGRVEEAGTGSLGGRSSEQTAADAGAEQVGLLQDPAGLRDQWQQIQGAFVDDPQRAVREASELVERTLQEIRTNITRGQDHDPTSTEDLRVSFRRYREFFQRLLSA